MAVKTKVQLTSDAQVIRDETVIDGNTATRVGEILIDMIDSLEEEGGATGTGTVTSVAVSGSDGIEVDSGSPITNSGTIALGLNKATTLSFLNVEDGADVTDADNIEDAITGTSADTLTDVSIIPFVKAATLVKVTWANVKATLKTYFDTLYANKNQATAEDLTLTGAESLDLSTFDSFEGLLTGNTTLSVTNTPASGVTFTRNLIISGSVGTETLTLPGTWNIYGEYVVDATNYLTIEFANFATNGLQVNCFINQPT